MAGRGQALRGQLDAWLGQGEQGSAGHSWPQRERGAALGAEVRGASASSLPRF